MNSIEINRIPKSAEVANADTVFSPSLFVSICLVVNGDREILGCAIFLRNGMSMAIAEINRTEKLTRSPKAYNYGISKNTTTL